MELIVKRGHFEIEFDHKHKYLWQYEQDFDNPIMIYHLIRPKFNAEKRFWEFRTESKLTNNEFFNLHSNHQIIVQELTINENNKLDIDIVLNNLIPTKTNILHKIEKNNIEDMKLYLNLHKEITENIDGVYSFLNQNLPIIDDINKRRHQLKGSK